MIILKLLKKHLVDTQIYVAIMACLLACFFMHEQNTFRLSTAVLIFITYLAGYLHTKYQGNKKTSIKTLIVNTIIAIIGLIIIYLNHNINTLISWIIIIILGLLYNSLFINYYIRKIPLVKIFYVGIVWGIVNAFIALENMNLPIFWISFFYISALIIPFDIRDIKDDKIVTFPRLVGIKTSKIIAYGLIIISNVISFFYLSIDHSISFFITTIIAAFLIYFSNEHRKDSYFSFWIETCCGLPFIIYFLSNTAS